MSRTKQVLEACGMAWLLVLSVCADALAEKVKATFKSEAVGANGKALTIRGVLSRPKGTGPFPAIVLLPNCGGPKTFEFAVFWPRYLNDLGYVTLNVDPFTPRGTKKCTRSYVPNATDLSHDAYGALEHLAGLSYVDKEAIGVLGSSLGAHTINAFVGIRRNPANELNFKAAVSLYPVHCRSLVVRAGMIPTLVIQGDKEKGVRSCKARKGLGNVVITILPKTYHGFDQPHATPLKNGRLRRDVKGNKRLYSRPATQKAQAFVKKFLGRRLRASPVEPSSQSTGAPVLGKVGNKDPYRAVNRRDNDGDGRVSLSEWEKSPAIFAKIDADQDGYLTPKEFYDHWQRRAKN